MTRASHPRVFLSYARKDGEAFATELLRRLAAEEPEITVWQDRGEMEGGIGWWAQIESALEQVKFLVIVLTPEAIKSQITRQEWQYARQRGVIVYPVKGVPDDQLEYGILPKWMRKAHFFDLGQWTGREWHDAKEWKTFVNYLKSDRQPSRVPFLAPELPRGFVPRPLEFDVLVRVVLDANKAQQPTTITTALQGSGGYGKTTLAIALCHDERVSAVFDDGVLWTSLGPASNVRDELAKWHEALTGQRLAFLDAADAAAKLAEKLEHRECLLVIDDVWDRTHLEPFLVGGRRCARVITTRRIDLLAGAPRIRVDEMRPAEAHRLLALALPTGAAADRIDALARRLGQWPLLLRLAAAMIQKRLDRGDSADGAVGFVERLLDKRGVVAFDARDAAARDLAVNLTVSASREQLDPADDRRFLGLAIFPEDESIPLTTLERMWRLDDVDTAECAQRLDDVALLSLDLRHGVVTIHDVMGEYLRQQTSDLAALHAQLVTGYGNVLRLPDAYAWGWLPYHLQRAGEIMQLRQLLLRPPWLQAQLRAIGAYAQLRAFEWVGEDRDLQLVRRALRLSLPALVADASQLCEQLLGRLPESVSAALDDFRRELLQMAPIPRLHGRWRNLIGPGSLIQTLSHNAGVAGVLELSDGRLLSWSADGTLRVWDLETGKGHSLAGHERGVNGAILLADNRVLSWSDDHSLRVWDLTIGQSRPLTGHQDVIDGALALPGGRALSWSRDATLRVWDLETGEGHALVGHEERVTGALMLRDGRAVSWGWDNSLRVWDLSTGQGRAVTGGEQVTDALILPDGRVLSWGWDHMLRIWDFATGQSRTLTGHTDAVEGAMVLPNGRVLSWSRDGTSRLWDLETGTGYVVSGETRLAGPLVLSDGRLLSRDGKSVPTIWDLATGQARPLNGDGRTKRAMLESQTTE